MNRRAAMLIADLTAAGAVDPKFIVPAPSHGIYARTGIIKATPETEKAEIAGLPCGVRSETATEARVFVEINGKLTGPYILKPSEVLS